MNRRRLLPLLAATAVVPMLLTACAGSAAGGDTGGGDDEGPLKIGMIFAQTGDVSALGVSARQGAIAAVDHLNEEGGVQGRELEAVFCDDASDVARVATCARELIDDGVVAVVGPITSPLGLAAAPLLGAAGIPQFAVGSATALVDPVQPHLFRGSSGTAEEMQVLSDYLEESGFTRVALLNDTGANGQDNVRVLSELLPEKGIEIVASETYDLDDTDVTAQLTKINGTDAEILVNAGSVQQIAVIAQNRAALGMTMPHLSGAGISTQAFVDLAGASAEGIRCLAWKVAQPDSIDPSDPLAEQVGVLSEALGDTPPDQFSGLAWDMVMVLAAAMESVDDPSDPAAVRDAVEAIGPHDGAASTWDYTAEDHRGNDTSGFFLAELRGGEFVPLDS